MSDIDADKVQAVADRLGATAIQADAADATAMERLAAQAGDARLICLDAGIVRPHAGPVWEVMADQRRQAVCQRGERLTSGQPPTMPRPAD